MLETELAASPQTRPVGQAEVAMGNYLAAKTIQNRDELARQLYADERIKRICRVHGLRGHISFDLLEDVFHLSIVRFFDETLADMKDAEAIYSVMSGIAYFITKEVRRESLIFAGYESIDASYEDEPERSSIREFSEKDVLTFYEKDWIGEIDQRMVARKMTEIIKHAREGRAAGPLEAGVFAMALPLPPSPEIVELTGGRATKPTKKTPKQKSKASQRSLSPLQQELVDIQEKLQFQNDQFAMMLGLNLSTLSSYIYGRTQSVPDDVMEKAREIYADSAEHVKKMEAKFNRPMSEILEDWQRRLKAPNLKTIADYLGVTFMSTTRWKNNKTKPSMMALVRYETTVVDLELHLRRTRKGIRQSGK